MPKISKEMLMNTPVKFLTAEQITECANIIREQLARYKQRGIDLKNEQSARGIKQ